MRDQQPEVVYHPRPRLSLDGVERVLCVAPHPDDEVFGCGGLLAALVDRGAHVQVLILTRGERSDISTQTSAVQAQRMQESLQAAKDLGYLPPKFLDFEDRGLRFGLPLLDALARAVQAFNPQLLLLPSLSEPHPDHQATALAGLEVAKRHVACTRVLFCEIGEPLQANVYLDLDAVADRKWRAVSRFTSQLGIESYDSHARAMAAMRAYGLHPRCQQAEAFFEVDLKAVRERGVLAALPHWPWLRERLHLANDPSQLPLVSILVRSMDRPCLAEALASVAVQTYPNIELVVLNASGRVHSALSYLPPHLPFRVVNPADAPVPSPCGRARAANLALEAAMGSLALFLDDDDLIDPGHIERLVCALHEHPRAAGAYAGVRVQGSNAAPVRDYDLPWSRDRLQGVNFLPIHAVLFRLDHVRRQRLAFDEALPVLEDWDFWLKLTEGAELIHCPGVSATYRQGLGQSSLGDSEHVNHWRRWHLELLSRQVKALPASALAKLLAWHAVEVDRLQTQWDAMAAHPEAPAALRAALQSMQSRLEEAISIGQQHLQARDALQARLNEYSLEVQAALAASQAELHRFSAQCQMALAEKQADLQRLAEQASRDTAALASTLADRDARLQAMLQSRTWRWGSRLRAALSFWRSSH